MTEDGSGIHTETWLIPHELEPMSVKRDGEGNYVWKHPLDHRGFRDRNWISAP